MALSQWSTTPANNASVGAIDWAEGQPPSTVNDSARQMMADVAVQFQNGWEWQQFGDTPTYVSGTQFTVPGNLTGRYTVGRRVRTFNTGGTLYGTITASAYTSLTTVTLTLDSGALDSGLSEVDVGIMNPTNPSLPTGMSPTFGIVYLARTGYTTYRFQNFNGGVYFNNGSDKLILDASGNLTATGTVTGTNITASSDERLKRDWEDVRPDFLETLASVQNGTFERISTGQRSAGVTAQSLQKALPEAVMEGPDGFLSVAYGQAALVACVELAREVLRLRALLEPVK